jgi:formylglycine-generating enzyme required for sulfatase activity
LIYYEKKRKQKMDVSIKQIKTEMWISLSLIVCAVFIASCSGTNITSTKGLPTPIIPTETMTITPESSRTQTQTPTKTPTLTPSITPTPTRSPTIMPSPTLGIGSTMVSPIDGMVMVYVPEGEFLTGISGGPLADIYPQHSVYLDAYWIDSFEVTNAMFILFTNATGYVTEAEQQGSDIYLIGSGIYSGADVNWRHPNGSDTDLSGLENYPVVNISWKDATEYCAWAGRRLPTEAEWEKAARGTDGRKQPWGEGIDCTMANIEGCGIISAVEVGTYPTDVSPYRAFDMAGNVSEYVADWYHKHLDATPEINPTGPSEGFFHIGMGGSFFEIFLGNGLISGWQLGPGISGGNFVGFRCATPS